MLRRQQEKRRRGKLFIAIVSVISALSGIAFIAAMVYSAMLFHH
jgi:hypothetical protein